MIVNGKISKYSLLFDIKSIPKEELSNYTRTYIKDHIYISSKNITGSYLYEYYNITHGSMDYSKIKHNLSRRFGSLLTLLLQEKRIIRYSPKLYKRVDTTIDLSKIVSPGPNKNNISLGPEIKNKVSRLIYSQGRFVNSLNLDIVSEIFNIISSDTK